MKILVLSQYYPPEPAPIPASVARGLVSLGHEVRVLTGLPNYPEGRLYAGYDTHGSIEWIDGVPVHRVRSHLSHSSNPFGRFVSYGSFALAGVKQQALVRGADVVYVYATQMTASVPALLASVGRVGTPYVLHVQDLWPESVTESSMVPKRVGRIMANLMNPWLSLTYRRAAAVVAIAPTMTRILEERVGPGTPVHTLLNWSEDARVNVGRDLSRTNGLLRLLYAGNLGDLQDLETIAAAVEIAVGRGLDVQWRIAGGGSAENRLRQRCEGLVEAGKVLFLGRLTPPELQPHLDWTDFQLVPLKDLPIFRGTVPSKLQGSMAAGIPVITTVLGDVQKIVSEHGTGFTSPPEDPLALADVLADAAALPQNQYEDMKTAARRLFEERMSSVSALGQLEDILHHAAVQGTTPSRSSLHQEQP